MRLVYVLVSIAEVPKLIEKSIWGLTEMQELGSDFPKNPYWLWTEKKNFWKSVRTWSETVQIDWHAM